MAAIQLKTLKPQHHQLIDWIVTHRAEKKWREACCEAFGISYTWLSIVMNSDLFREALETAQAAHSSELRSRIIEKQAVVAEKALEKLEHIIDDDEVDDKLVADVANNALRNLGLAAKPGAAPQIETEKTLERTREVSPGVLETARITYRKLTSESEALPAPS